MLSRNNGPGVLLAINIKGSILEFCLLYVAMEFVQIMSSEFERSFVIRSRVLLVDGVDRCIIFSAILFY